jgi:hypothetical protein
MEGNEMQWLGAALVLVVAETIWRERAVRLISRLSNRSCIASIVLVATAALFGLGVDRLLASPGTGILVGALGYVIGDLAASSRATATKPPQTAPEGVQDPSS